VASKKKNIGVDERVSLEDQEWLLHSQQLISLLVGLTSKEGVVVTTFGSSDVLFGDP